MRQTFVKSGINFPTFDFQKKLSTQITNILSFDAKMTPLNVEYFAQFGQVVIFAERSLNSTEINQDSWLD